MIFYLYFRIISMIYSSISMEFSDLVGQIKTYNPNCDEQLLQLAYEFARDAHAGQVRVNGEDYVQHSLATAMNLANMKMDDTTIIAGLLHDVPKMTSVTAKDIQKNFGTEIAGLVEGVTKLGQLKYRGMERYAENLRNMFVAMAKDLRVVLIKFADRLHNLESLSVLEPVKQQRIATEVLEIYAPIANRLGMGAVKKALEDKAFEYVFPEDYRMVYEQVAPKYKEKEQYFSRVQDELSQSLRENGVTSFSIEYRLKGFYSIFRKMKKKDDESINALQDLVALRVIVDSVADCYTTLGVIHQLWKPLSGRIKDYIAQPKPNNYRSLHTTVFCENGEIVEFQIRTKDMDKDAKFGIAAHWSYDESGKNSVPVKKIDWLQEASELPQAEEEYAESVRLDVFKDRIFVFTPRGDVINLTEDSTIIDFAYHIHSEVGLHCIGGKINDVMSSLDTKLSSGDVVEIITDKNRKKPNIDWLKFAKTSFARSRIRAQLREAGELLSS